MAYTLRDLTMHDRGAVLEIYNHYITHSFAAYREDVVGEETIGGMMASQGALPALAVLDGDELVGFGLLVPHKEIPTFAHAANLICFLRQEATGGGVGRLLLAQLEERGRCAGVTTILSSISSRNPASLRFHEKNGFRQCGRFVGVGIKHGQPFDTVWMQKDLGGAAGQCP